MIKKIKTKKEISEILPIEFRDIEPRLKLKELKFIAAYCCNGFNGGAAAIEAGYSKNKNSAYNIASKLLNNDNVLEALRRYAIVIMAPYKEKIKMEVLLTRYNRAFYNISDFYNDEGKLKSLDDIPGELKCVIDGVDEKRYGKDGTEFVILYKLADREKNLSALWEWVGMADEQITPNNMKKSIVDLRKFFDENKKEVSDV